MKDNKSNAAVFLEIDGKKYSLTVPAIWSPVQKRWSGYIETPKTNRRIYGEGTTLLQVQEGLQECLKNIMQDKLLATEIKQMFKRG